MRLTTPALWGVVQCGGAEALDGIGAAPALRGEAAEEKIPSARAAAAKSASGGLARYNAVCVGINGLRSRAGAGGSGSLYDGTRWRSLLPQRGQRLGESPRDS